MIKGTRCDGQIDCWNGEDEEMCGFNTFVTFGAGNLPYFCKNDKILCAETEGTFG